MRVNWTVDKLALLFEAEALGDADLEISRLTCLEEAGSDTLSPLLHKAALSRVGRVAGGILCTPELAEAVLEAGAASVLVHPEPRRVLSGLLEVFAPQDLGGGDDIHKTAVVAPDAKLAPGVKVGPLCVIESDVCIEAGVRIDARAVVCAGTRIGADSVIGPGAVIGGEGFGYIAEPGNKVRRIKHLGNVVIGRRVEIGANTCVDRATLGSTVIGDDTKLDNLVQIGHNCRIGRGVLIAGQVGVAGSTIIEDGVLIGGQAGIGDHLVIGAGARIAGKSGVTSNVSPGATVAGYPAWEHRIWLRAMASMLRAARGRARNRES